MANPSEQSGDKLSLVYDTALCIIPPSQSWPFIDRLRSLYDKTYEKWPPHVNLVYPFVRPEMLPTAADRIQAALSQQEWDVPVELDSADAFLRKNDNTIFRHDGDASRTSTLGKLRNEILRSIGHAAGASFRMHMTIAQSEDANSTAHQSLVAKVGLLPTVGWKVDELHILVRERLQQVDGRPTSQMKLWGTVSLSDGSLSQLAEPKPFYDVSKTPNKSVDEETETETGERDQLRTNKGYYYNEEFDSWEPYTTSQIDELQEQMPEMLTVSSYNVLAGFDWPPSEARHPLLIKNILSKDATADVLVLQEVTDVFLSALLTDDLIRERYPYASHGPPSQPDVEPLPSMLNVIILSQFPFDWEFVSFHRKHKGSVVAKFRDIKRSGSGGLPTIVAGVHLSHGLTDGAVAAKKIEIQMLLRYLSQTYPQNPLILAGDTNITTSSCSINAALQKKSISAATVNLLASFDTAFSEAGLSDAWTVSRSEMGDVSYIDYDQDESQNLFEGEQGATYDPLRNEVAAEMVGSGFNNRPQRIDRIFVRGGKLLEIARFNKFGFLREKPSSAAKTCFGSDHWGVRCVLKLHPDDMVDSSQQHLKALVVPVHQKKAPSSLSHPDSVKECLANLGGVLPDDAESTKRKTALEMLKKVLIDSASEHATVIVVPVGSYALGVWTSSSDMDILCIGPFSSTTFFALATQRLKKASSHGEDIRILRRVKANTGLMLELQVNGIKTDLQYCPAGAIAQGFPQVLTLPASDPVWSLAPQTLSKLKALRDVDYLHRSIPDLPSFRLAHRFIKTWAKSRGIYTARFGFLGGIHISILLARVHKLLVRDNNNPGMISVPDLLTTFFHHYADFDWEKHLVFDPFFHKRSLNYTRTPREPLAILGYFPPSLNTAHAASVPSTRTIAAEFQRASAALLSSPDNMSWSSFLASSGAADFLTTYKSYIKLDVQYWGFSPTRGAQFIGWLESRLVMLLVDMNRRAPSIYARIWPGRFITTTTADTPGDEEETTRDEYQTIYLIGLDRNNDRTTSKEEMQLLLGQIQTSLSRFTDQIRKDGKYFDERACWLAGSVINRSELAALDVHVDDDDFGLAGEYTPGEEEDDESDDESQEEEGLDSESSHDDDSSSKKAAKRTGKKKGTAQVNTSQPQEEGKKPKFRTALDVMNRIRWDPGIDSSDYIIGYEDRFLGARERPLDNWNSELTDEEFIPLHRILYFKRRRRTAPPPRQGLVGEGDADREAGDDGGGMDLIPKKERNKDKDWDIVWERRTRTDLIFGSGTALLS
ncbi:hypothetical protein V8F33_003073 [Rhypophila sp. PSN 637]